MSTNNLLRTPARDILADREQQFRELTEHIEDVFYLMDRATSSVVFVNPAYETIWGEPAEQLYADAESWLRAIRPDDREHVLVALQNLWRGDPFDEEYRIVRADGSTRWIRDRAYPIEDNAGHIARITGIATDITEQRELTDQLRHAQKLEAVGTLASGVAHDFNNLLMGIAGCASIAADSLPADSPAQTYLEEIRASAASGAAISRQLTAFSRKDAAHPAVVSVDDVVADNRTLLERLLREDIALTLSPGGVDTRVRCDRSDLDQLLVNLATNAQDAMPRGGRLTIATRETVIDSTDALPGRLGTGAFVRLTVVDTGCGMSPAVCARLFEPFFTTKRKGKGTGLGMSTVYGVVRRAGGHIDVHSVPGVGTTIDVLLPRVRDRVTREVPVVAPLADAPAHGTVLVVEDERMVRMTARHYLEQAGYTVLEAADGPSAIECARTHRGPIDLVLLDIVLPGLGGEAVARAIGDSRPATPTLFMSAHDAASLSRADPVSAGAGTLQKPFDRNVLLARVRAATAPAP